MRTAIVALLAILSFVSPASCLDATNVHAVLAAYCAEHGKPGADVSRVFITRHGGTWFAEPKEWTLQFPGVPPPKWEDLEGIDEHVAAQNYVDPASLPVLFPTGLEVPHVVFISLTNEIGIGISVDDDGNLVSYDFHASPVDFNQVASNRSAALADHKLLRQDMRNNLEAINSTIDMVTTNIAEVSAGVALTNGFTAAENRTLSNLLRREAIDASREMKSLAQEVKELQRIILKMHKED